MKPAVFQKRKAFTLIEIILVLVILSMVSGVVGINIRHAVRQERFHASVRRVVDRLQMAQDLMLISGHSVDPLDTEISFPTEDEKLFCRFDFKGENPPKLTSLFKKEIQLEEVGDVTFETDGSTELSFHALGNRVPKGTLKLISKRGGLERFISLVGYPTKIQSSAQRVPLQSAEDLEQESAELYPDELRQKA